MSRIIIICTLIWAWGSCALAQEFNALARIDASNSRIVDARSDGVRVELTLSQGVPYRLFTLDQPPRLVLDFNEVDWTGLTADGLNQTDRVGEVRFGSYVPGWSRMVLQLSGPMSVNQAQLQLGEETGFAVLELLLRPVSGEEFAANAGAPKDALWDLPDPANVVAPAISEPDAPLRVMLDPGHGGIDPGAETPTTDEKTLMLTFARELREQLLRAGGFEVMMTRDSDHFVSLERRITLAHRAGADVFISLHADSLAEGQAHGAAVYSLSDAASDIASAKLAERQDRADLLSGTDLSTADDLVADVLLDLARQETKPRTRDLARALADGMAQQGGPMNRRPLREASFSVLKAADIPSVLIELGFLSSPRDLKNLSNAAWRKDMARGVQRGLTVWREADLAKRSLLRH